MPQLSHLGPAVVILQAVNGQGDQFDLAFAELAAQPGNSTQLCGAHRGVVPGVGEQDSPSGEKRDISGDVSGVKSGSGLLRWERFSLTQFPFI